jgi:outer membrane murein-binding lipoprotein Lpp
MLPLLLLAEDLPPSTVAGVVVALIGVIASFMKLTSGANARVDTVTARQIKQLVNDRDTARKNEMTAWSARDEAQEEADTWRHRYDEQVTRTHHLELENVALRTRLGMEPNGD